MPRAIAVTKLEQAWPTSPTPSPAAGASSATPGDGTSRHRRGIVTGGIDLLRRRVLDARDGTSTQRDADPEEAELIEEQRGPLMESIIEESEDEDLLERHLNGEEIDLETIATDLRAAVATAQFFPIIATHALSGMGADWLHDLFEQGFTSGRTAAAVHTTDGKPFPDLTCDLTGPLVAEVVRTTSDPFVGRLSLVRVFSARSPGRAAARLGAPAALCRPPRGGPCRS